MIRRKLIAHGPSSLTVSLPSVWVKRHSLLKGGGVFVTEDENGCLVVSPSPRETVRRISIDISGYDSREIFTVMTTIYRRGYDEVAVRYASFKEYESLTGAARQLLGFAVVEHTARSCTVRLLAEGEYSDFRNLLRRVFFVLLQELEDFGRAVSSKEELSTFSRRDEDVNILVNLALRLINKGYVPSRFHELHLYYALLILEELGDDLLRFSIELRSARFDQEVVRRALASCKEMLQLLADQFFEDRPDIGKFYQRYYLYDTLHPHHLSGKVPKPTLYASFKKQDDALLFYPRSFVEKVVALAETLLLPAIREERPGAGPSHESLKDLGGIAAGKRRSSGRIEFPSGRPQQPL